MKSTMNEKSQCPAQKKSFSLFYQRILKTPEGKKITADYWNQKTEDTEPNYWNKKLKN